MNDQDDELRNIALAVVAGVVALVIGGVIALSAATLADVPTASKNLAAADDAATPFGPPQALRFEPGSDRLSADAADVLNRWSESARLNSAATVLISGLAANDATADRRLATLRHALEANGVAPGRIVVGAPSGGDAQAAGNVELRLQ